MPDPAKSVTDIDDVLSSIRRLVAEHPGRDISVDGDPGLTPSDDADAAPEAASDRLVLTPALRVANREGESSEPARNGLAHAATDLDVAMLDDLTEGEATGPTESPDDGNADTTAGILGTDITTDGSAYAAADGDSNREMTPGAQDVPAADTERAEAGEDVSTGPAPEALGATHRVDSAHESSPASDGGRAVGSGDWRAEMRLHDWQAGAKPETMDPGTGTRGPSGDFEPDAGDADWPDKTTNRALRDLAAARAVPAPDGQDVPGIVEAEVDRDNALPHTAGDVPAAPDTAPASKSTPVSTRGSDAIAVSRMAGHAPKPGRPDDVPLNPFSAAAGSEVGGDDADDWDYDDAFAGIADAREGDWPAGAGGSTAGKTPGDSNVAPSLTREAPESTVSGTQVAGNRAKLELGDGATDAAHDAARHIVADGTTDLVEPLSAAPNAPSDDASTTGVPPVVPPMILDTPLDASASDRSSEISDRSAAPCEDTGAEGDEPPTLDTTILDEETLRRIVAEVVREELQGELGERITRNIRKLVRREIRLVLAADDVD